MRLPTLFRLPKYDVFDYKPRYWDKKKEELKIRIESIKRELGQGNIVSENGNYVPDIKGRMRFRDIAKLQGVPTSTSCARYRYGLDKLRSLLNSEVRK